MVTKLSSAIKSTLILLLLVCFGLILAVLITELILNLTERSDERAGYRSCNPCSYIYEHIPSSGWEVNGDGFRGAEVPIQKVSTKKRIAFLGDSVTFGALIDEAQTFPRIIANNNLEIINAGVTAYNTFNELQLFKDKVSKWKPELVVLQTCFNDLADPRAHKLNLPISAIDFPVDSIPNPLALSSSQLKVYEPSAGLGILEHSMIFKYLRKVFLVRQFEKKINRLGRVVDQKFVPTYITGEVPQTLDIWLDKNSIEWQWLRKNLDRLRSEVTAINAKLVILILPLAYQLDPAYPLRPEEGLLEYCNLNNVTCLDMVSLMRGRDPDQTFLMQGDVWHLNIEGHAFVAEHLKSVIESE